MKGKTLLILAATIFSLSLKGQEKGANPANPERFNKEKDLLLAHYDFKTDVDDLHSAAAFFTLLQHPGFTDIQHHVLAGAYGTQEGPYVPPGNGCWNWKTSGMRKTFSNILPGVAQKQNKVDHHNNVYHR